MKGSLKDFRLNRAADLDRFGDIHNRGRRNFLAKPKTALRSGQWKRIMLVFIHHAFFLVKAAPEMPMSIKSTISTKQGQVLGECFSPYQYFLEFTLDVFL